MAEVSEGGDITAVAPVGGATVAPAAAPAPAPAAGPAEPVPAPLAGNILRVIAQVGQTVQEGDLLVILEAMKMETEIRAPKAGTVASVDVKVGDAIVVGQSLLSLS